MTGKTHNGDRWHLEGEIAEIRQLIRDLDMVLADAQRSGRELTTRERLAPARLRSIENRLDVMLAETAAETEARKAEGRRQRGQPCQP
jgi:hypothetical protein